MLSLLGDKFTLVLIAIIGVMALGGWLYMRHTTSVISQLNQDKARLETAVQLQEQTIAAQREAAARQNAEIYNLQNSVAQAEGTRRDLEARLRRADLQARARANSAELEASINRATTQAFRDIETITQRRDGNGAVPPPATPSATTPNNTTRQPPPRPPASRSVSQ